MLAELDRRARELSDLANAKPSTAIEEEQDDRLNVAVIKHDHFLEWWSTWKTLSVIRTRLVPQRRSMLILDSA